MSETLVRLRCPKCKKEGQLMPLDAAMTYADPQFPFFIACTCTEEWTRMVLPEEIPA